MSLNLKKSENSSTNKKNRKVKVNVRIFSGFLVFVSVFLFFTSFMFEQHASVVLLAFSLLSAGATTIYDAINKIKEKNYINLNLLISLCAVLVFSLGSYYQGVVIFLVYSLQGVALEYVLKDKPRLYFINEEIKKRVYHIVVERQSQVIRAKDIVEGDFVELFSGEIIPVDGTVMAGSGTVSTRDVTGDAKVCKIHSKDKVLSGYTLLSGNLIVEAESDVAGSTFGKMEELISKAETDVTKGESRLNNYAYWYSIIVGIATLAFVTAKYIQIRDFNILKFGLPISLLLCSVDIFKEILSNAYMTAIYSCGEKGVLIKTKSFVEKALNIKNVLFDGKGVLTYETPEIAQISTLSGVTKDELIRFASLAQCRAENSVSKIVLARYGEKIRPSEIAVFKQLEGNGAMVKLTNGIEIVTGNPLALKELNIAVGIENDDTKLCVAINNTYVGHIAFDYKIKEDIRQSVDTLRFAGIKKIAVLSCDNSRICTEMASKGGIDLIHHSLDHRQTEDEIKSYGKNSLYVKSSESENVDFVPVLTYGELKKCENAEAVSVVSSLIPVLKLINIMKDTKALIIQNVIIDIALKIIVLLMLLNFSSLVWIAVALVVGIQILLKINNYRVLKKI